MRNTYEIINKFECYGVTMVVVLIKGTGDENKSVSTMTEEEYNRIIEDERRYMFEKKIKKKIKKKTRV